LVDDAGRLGIRDFRGSSAVATPTQRHTDRVQALVASVIAVGVPAAVAAARRHLDDDTLAATLPFLQPAVLTPAQRRLVKDAALDLGALRAEIAGAIGAEVPELQQLRRLSPALILRVLLPAVAVVALLSMLAGLDLGELVDLLADASWWLLAVGFLAAQLPRLTQAVSTVGAAPVPMPLGPVYALQLAVSYINIAIPSAAARVALNIRFFQRHGMAPGTALAAGALDGFGGFVVQAALLAGLLVLTPASLDLDLGNAVDGVGPLVLVVALVAVIAMTVVLAVGRVRRFVLHWVRRLATEALAAVRGLRSPRRLAMLLGGNLATEVLFASTLGIFVAALGHHVGLGALLLTNISVALLAGLLPVPGGIGVAEGGLTVGLVQAGVPEQAAFAAVLLYRLATFYLPPLWGYVAMRWLERNQHL
ncbi:MAG TPA: lysylphosphatidylglycerol synthase transmembrane domain-containing protein, partial [Ilumatobacteraceae bacterium]|nr:lysylphosphatidylglycerol synthase transmembrane domain-containing protein [Ilumatobacteraceae bacterium]